MTTETKVYGKTEIAEPKVREPKVVPAHSVTPLEEFDRMMERMFEGWLPRGWLRPLHFERHLLPELGHEGWLPKVDVIERDDEVVVRAEVPGVEKKDLDISVTENSVTIQGQTRREQKEEKGNYYRCEISRGMFARTVTLPSEVETEKVKAEFKDGVLELTMPKVEKSKRRTIKLE